MRLRLYLVPTFLSSGLPRLPCCLLVHMAPCFQAYRVRTSCPILGVNHSVDYWATRVGCFTQQTRPAGLHFRLPNWGETCGLISAWLDHTAVRFRTFSSSNQGSLLRNYYVRILRMCFPRGSWDFGPRKSSHSLGLALPAPFLATWETYQVFLVSRWETALDFACLGLVSPLCRVNLVVSYWLIET